MGGGTSSPRFGLEKNIYLVVLLLGITPMDATSIIEKLEKELERAHSFNKVFSKRFSKNPSKAIREGLARTARITKRFSRFFRSQDFGKLDDFFFSRKTLLPGAKEYWFINLVSTSGDRTQLILTFGSSDLKTKVNKQVAPEGKVAAVGWLYSGKKKVFLEKSISLESKKGLLKTSEFEFRGAYPSFGLTAGEGTRIRFSKPRHGISFETLNHFVSSLGVGILN